MKNLITITLCVVIAMIAHPLLAQETEEKDKRPVRPPFESALLLDGQTVIVPSKGTLEFDIQHRFGTIDNGFEDLFGLYAPSNIRLALSYTIIENLSIGLGNTKNDNLLDFNIKYAVLKQTRSWSTPVSVTYFANSVLDMGDDVVDNGLQRWSYFHEILISSKINSALSVQVSGNYSHFNGVEKRYFKLADNNTDSLYRNDVIGASIKARYKFGQIAAIAGADIPLVGLYGIDKTPNYSFGIEISTSAHAFQVFAGNFNTLIPQRNYAFNENSFGDKQILIGFNITRLWNF